MKANSIKTIPYLKVLFGALKFVENPIPIITSTMAEYGHTYASRIIGGKKVIMTIDPEVVRHVLQKNNRNYHKSEMQTVSLGRYVGKGLLTTNGDYWLKQRRLIQPGFHKARLETLVKIMNDEILEFCDDLSRRINEGEEVFEITREMTQLTLRIVSKSLFSSGISDKKIDELGRNFTALQKHIVREVRQPFLSFWRVLRGQRKRAMKLAVETKQIVVDIIRERKRNGSSSNDLLDMLMDSRYEDTGESMNDTQILDEAIILFTAGHETTANSLAWTLYLLEENKSQKNRLLDELAQIDTRDISMSGLSQLEFCKNVISESMRLYPPAWILDRVALEADDIKNVHINKGDLVGLFVYGSHRNGDVWKDADKFEPNRFQKSSMSNIPPYSYYPFGGGPRLCIGNHFAIMEMQLALMHLCTRFEFELVKEQQIEVEPLITLRPKYGIRMKVSERRS